MATGVKAAAFAALVRLLMEAFPSAGGLWQPVVAALAIASMAVGNLVALAQRSLKRMLAYSSIAHAGYMLVAVWAGTQPGAGAVLLYLLAYGLTTLASFGLLTALGRGGERDVTYDDIAGLAATRPAIAFGLSVCMLSLLGFPGTVGFIGKWYILTAAVAEGQMILPVILVLTSVLSAALAQRGPSRRGRPQLHGGGGDRTLGRGRAPLRPLAGRSPGAGRGQRADADPDRVAAGRPVREGVKSKA
jgi:NADH-quinone oxidoreductase subunit N